MAGMWFIFEATRLEVLLSGRLSEQNRLEPKLEAEEKRRNFDIHVYGDEVMGRVAAASKSAVAPVTFAQAVCGLSAHDVCRSFLATLQLANDGNVEISLRGGYPFPRILIPFFTGILIHHPMLHDGSCVVHDCELTASVDRRGGPRVDPAERGVGRLSPPRHGHRLCRPLPPFSSQEAA